MTGKVTARLLIFFLLFLSLSCYGQAQYPPINQILNRISCGELNHFYSKLQSIENNKAGRAVVVQIGDSHTQPDFISSVLRKRLQEQFGNAGRGLIFPYSLALSNSPLDIRSSSSIKWQYNRVAHPELGTNSGVSGFIIYTQEPSGEFSLRMNDSETVDSSAVRFFWGKSLRTEMKIFINDEMAERIPENDVIIFPGAFQKLDFHFNNNDSVFSFYGMNVENMQSGLIYHNIGVNGARFDQYNMHPQFWKDLASLQADLFIVSLGTNEAQKDNIDIDAFQKEIKLFVDKLSNASPQASILITTAMDSYKRQKPNMTLKQINDAIIDYCEKQHVASWDLYRVTNGFGSSRQWLKIGLMNKDRIHFLREGYTIQGDLLYKALMTGYNSYKNAEIRIEGK